MWIFRESACLTEFNMRANHLNKDAAHDSATLLAKPKVASENRIMLFGIKHYQTEAIFQDWDLGPVDAILIASDLSVSTCLADAT